jgi:lysophospholipase L1-like esterase
MHADFKARLVDPYVAIGGGEDGPFPFDLYAHRCLAQGDSWFSIGSIPPGLTTNTLEELWLSRSAAVVNCARPGKLLRRMTNTVSEPHFLRLLTGKLALRWDAILVSGGGNDLIEAATVSPAADTKLRLLRRPDERPADPSSGDDYVNPAGWGTFEGYLRKVFGYLVRKRDSGINAGVPMVLHNYARIVPRPAPAGFGHGPWLETALAMYDVPVDDELAVADALLARLDRLIRALLDEQTKAPNANLHLVDTRAAGLEPADADATGPSGDWLNEIHPTRDGYRKLARRWRDVLDPLLDAGGTLPQRSTS